MGIKKILGKVIPVAASVASSGLLGGSVAKSITDILGVGRDASDTDIEAALAKASPEQLVELRKLETQVTLQAEQLGFQRSELIFKDKDSARKREMTVRDKTPQILAFLITGALMGVILILMLRGADIDSGIAHVLSVLVGYLGAGFQTMLTYYFGSSAGSKEKTAALGEALKR